MAEDKNGFVLYADLIHTINKMPNDKAGELFKHILSYVNDLDPKTDDLIIQLTFEPIKQQLKRDLQKYNKSKEESSLKGRIGNLKRWNIDLYKKYESNEISLEDAENIAKNRKVSLPDNQQSQSIAKIAVNVNDSVSVNDKVINNNIIESIDFDVLLDSINKSFGRNFKLISDKVKKSFNARLKEGYGKEDIKFCIINLKKDSFHKENGYKYCTPEFISRSSTLDKYSESSTINNDNVYIPQQDLN